MGESNLPKIEIKADLTKTIENAYGDILKNPLGNSSNVISTVLDFFHNTVLYPMQKYNLYAKDKLQNYASELQNRAQSIPKENLTNPRVNILGPAIEGLKYNLDEEYIKEMFTNILISDMNTEKQRKVLPAYIEIIKQLSKEDAQFLHGLKFANEIHNLAIIRLKLIENTSGDYRYISSYVVCLSAHRFIRVSPVVLDNLLRLKIFEKSLNEYVSNDIYYEDTFNSLIKLPDFSKYSDIKDNHLGYSKGILYFTEFGKNFINICLS